MWIEPITDWDGVTEDRKWYNFGDLNRVENNTNEIADIIESYTTRPPIGTVITNRDNTNIDFYDSLNRIENNILTLKNASYEPAGFIQPKTDWESLQGFSYIDANRLELNLLLLYILVNAIKGGLLHCGAFYAGQNTIL